MRARILVLVILVVVGVVLAFGGTAHAKGPSGAEITGEGITTPIAVGRDSPPREPRRGDRSLRGGVRPGTEPDARSRAGRRARPAVHDRMEPAVVRRWTHHRRPDRAASVPSDICNALAAGIERVGDPDDRRVTRTPDGPSSRTRSPTCRSTRVGVGLGRDDAAAARARSARTPRARPRNRCGRRGGTPAGRSRPRSRRVSPPGSFGM